MLRASGDATDVACFHDADFGETESSRSADIELQQLSADSEQFRSIGGGGGGGDGANFEDEFDPILASIRKPAHDPGRASPIRVSSASPTRTGRPASTASASSPRDGFESFLPGERDDRDPYTSVTDGYRGNPPAAGGTFASGLLSMFPGNMRARAEDVMAQSSASISKSAGAFRSALESSGGSSAAAAAKGKRRESDPPYLMDAASRSEEGRGKNGAGGGGGRMMAGDGDEEDVPMVSVNDLLSDDEVSERRADAEIPHVCDSFFSCAEACAVLVAVDVGLTICVPWILEVLQ